MLSHKTDHLAQGLGRLIEQYREDEVLVGILTAWLEQVQMLEDAMWVEQGLCLANATGVTLDGFGSIVGEDRKGRDDETYRAAIYLRRAILFGDSTPTHIMGVLDLIESRDYIYTPYYHANYFVRMVDALGPTPLLTFAQILRRISPAAVRWYFHYSLVDDLDTMRTAVGDDVEIAGAGLGMTSDDYDGSLAEQGSFMSQVMDTDHVDENDSILTIYVDNSSNPYVDSNGYFYVEGV